MDILKYRIVFFLQRIVQEDILYSLHNLFPLCYCAKVSKLLHFVCLSYSKAYYRSGHSTRISEYYTTNYYSKYKISSRLETRTGFNICGICSCNILVKTTLFFVPLFYCAYLPSYRDHLYRHSQTRKFYGL